MRMQHSDAAGGSAFQEKAYFSTCSSAFWILTFSSDTCSCSARAYSDTFEHGVGFDSK